MSTEKVPTDSAIVSGLDSAISAVDELGNSLQQAAAKANLHNLLDQVDDVKHIMKDNEEKMIERGVKLHELEEKSEAIKEGAAHFIHKADDLKHNQ